ncbi:MAG: DNA polymerase III subunit gamma/tau [Planctomycetales bacterium]|nr:DNA polymerase III subunit gamma/tau [Planctomycetales bacterium]
MSSADEFSALSPDAPGDASARGGEYVVVARRYRPKLFGELVGQEHVAQALRNAIKTNRVGHAYLFTGARGVGKTSTARIFAKALNDPGGPTDAPSPDSDIARSIDAGEDVDVLEIDGASNRGIDEIRQLRSNVNIRPSRARFKIYIIDEVHMLTTAAFNALLKTLEEPPEHVKFIFCTTDPEKIPITVLSRCQRFDFAPVQTDSIVGRLRYIVDHENVQAEDEALQMLARRAGGSMRDSQSLLEQLLSFCGDKITVDDVHSMLGTARSGRLTDLSTHLIQRDAAAALRELDAAVQEGVDVGQLAEQLLGYFRDLMAALVGCDRHLLLHNSPQDYDALRAAAERFGLETLMAAAQVLDQTLVRMRQSTQSRTLVEMALVRICRLENLDQLAGLIAAVEKGVAIGGPTASSRPQASSGAAISSSPPSASRDPLPPESANTAQKKTTDLGVEAAETPQTAPPKREISTHSVGDLWTQMIDRMEDLTADDLRQVVRFATPAPNRIVAFFPAGYTLLKEKCERSDRKSVVERTLSQLAGQPVRVEFELEAAKSAPAPTARPPVNLRQLQRDVEQHRLIQDAKTLFDCEITRIDPPRG